jgi:glycosyltransferase involved in cell wall biosynthesis
VNAAPPLTVGLPIYNGAEFLVEALDSILGQTFGDFRLVVSDNGSSDATESICREYASRDARVAYLRYDLNRGAAWNFNNVFAHCETPYFRWAAADDVFATTCFERCQEAMVNAPPSVALCYTRTLVIDAEGAVVGAYDDELDLRGPSPHKRIGPVVRRMVQGNPTFGVVRSNVLRATRGHGSFPGADYVILVEVALRGEIWEIPERLFLRRRHAGISRVLHPSSEEYTLFFDPTAKPVRRERLRLLREYLAAVRHADLTPLERAACYATVTTEWTRRYGSIKRPLRKLEAALRPRLGVAGRDRAGV